MNIEYEYEFCLRNTDKRNSTRKRKRKNKELKTRKAAIDSNHNYFSHLLHVQKFRCINEIVHSFEWVFCVQKKPVRAAKTQKLSMSVFIEFWCVFRKQSMFSYQTAHAEAIKRIGER